MVVRPDRPDTGPETRPVEGMRTWRTAHPRATLAEIEREATRQVASLRAALIAAAVQDAVADEAPSCEHCHRRMARAGTRTRTVITDQREPLTITGHRYRCSACGAELFPPGGDAGSGIE